MILSCPSCQARYLVNPTQLGDAGRRVKCARCHHVWYASRPPEPATPLSATTPPSTPAEDSPRPVFAARSGNDGTIDSPFERAAAEPPVSGQLPSTIVRRRSRMPAVLWTLLILLVGGIAVVGVVAGGDVVRLYPPAIALYDAVDLRVDRSALADHPNLQPALEFADVESAIGEDGGLIVSGSLTNDSAERRRVLPLIVTLLDDQGDALASQEVDLGQTSIDGGQSVAFEVSIDPWPEGAVEADLGFAR